ncbi:4'-phosphopantetheinyl transferase superfamily protein [Nonomuraea jiangxiensis]|uniref:4'-phosphopantetheinyl transferase superfamily protein n=2 Tax=Nonomuraea jiangxiensis TaxID=633440 RepID=A0A1G9GTQ5_9ACTN|nr:4'-phosphopantetheinyl transferase superfamily protein [Nonomuraea jiangxiensis]
MPARLPGPQPWDRVLFCAMEALYKAWFPLTETWAGFRDAVVEIEPGGGFAARMLLDAAGRGRRSAGSCSARPWRPGRPRPRPRPTGGCSPSRPARCAPPASPARAGWACGRTWPAVTVPAVVLAGDADKVIAPELGEAVAAALPYARFERVPGAGHTLPLEAPGRIVMAVAELAGR